jgi:hypothetical protein
MATTNSTEYGNTVAVPAVMNDVCDEHARVRIRSFTYTQVGAGASGDLINLCKLPAGNIRTCGVFITNSALGASRTVKVGHTGYTNLANTTVAASSTAFLAATSVAAAGQIADHSTQKISSKEGLTVQALIEGGTIPDATTLNGYVLYALD